MDLHYSQTLFKDMPLEKRFHYLMDLHYSQTSGICLCQVFCFTTLWIYTILKLILHNITLLFCFTTLWIYTILKRK